MWNQLTPYSAFAITLFLSSVADCLPHHNSPPAEIFKRAEDDPFTPHDPPFVWYALGDSYTAGPGAGEIIDPDNDDDCRRQSGAYGPQLNGDWPYNGENDFNFIACTGDRTYNVIDNQLEQISSDPAPDLVVMTIGGNDVGFSKIAKSCLIGLWGSGDCDDKMSDARSVMRSPDFYKKLETIYNGIFDQMPDDTHYQVLHLGYSKFFNVDEDSTWCNDQSFGKFGLGSKPKLTHDLRKKLNDLTDELNSMLHIYALKYAMEKLRAGDWERQRLWFGNYDQSEDYSFAGHRFCEPGVEDPQFGDESTWIFGVWGPQSDVSGTVEVEEVSADYFADMDPDSCEADERYEDDDVFAWDCDMAILYDDGTAEGNVTTIPGLDTVRPFHPKSSGFGMVKNYIVNWMSEKRAENDLACFAVPDNDDDVEALAEQDPPMLCAPPDEPDEPEGNCASQCECGESSCSETSPWCCANGSCDESC